MKDKSLTKNKHLTLEDRREIKNLLDRGITFKAIAKVLGKDPTTISKEVKKHMFYTTSSITIKDSSGKLLDTNCSNLLKAPFVCNPCHKLRYCRLSKRLYKPEEADRAYRALLKEAREGVPLTKPEFYALDAIISKGLNKGQHLYQIMKTNDIQVSKSTIYRHFDKGYFSVTNLDLPRKVKFKARKSGHIDYVPRAAKLGRTYLDFCAYINENSITSCCEMDTVIGTVGGKVIMTFYFTSCNFMFGILLENRTVIEVTQKIFNFKAYLLNNGFNFGDIFPILLTDNGGEFSNITVFECDALGNKETSLFFCDPNAAYQKPNIEKNHTLFRDIVPSGSSFDHYSQETVNLIFSHVNSVKRSVMRGKSPFELFVFYYGSELATVLGISEIPADLVIQSPKLLSPKLF